MATNPNRSPIASNNTVQDLKLTDPLARCNDGSPAAMAFRPGTPARQGNRRWVIVLEGGGICTSAQQCQHRACGNTERIGYEFAPPGAATNRKVTLDASGIQSNVYRRNPDFFDANIVKVGYRSSDWWSAERDPTSRPSPGFRPSNTATWSFRGRTIAKAAVTQLIQQHGLGEANEVLLAGASAGGMGVILTANDLLPLLPNKRVAIVTDAGFCFDYRSAPAGRSPLDDLITAGQAVWGGTGLADCTLQGLGCWKPSAILAAQAIPAPVFVSMLQQEQVQLRYNGLLREPKPSPAEFVRQLTSALRATNAQTMVFAPAEAEHVWLNTPAFTGAGPGSKPRLGRTAARCSRRLVLGTAILAGSCPL